RNVTEPFPDLDLVKLKKANFVHQLRSLWQSLEVWAETRFKLMMCEADTYTSLTPHLAVPQVLDCSDSSQTSQNDHDVGQVQLMNKITIQINELLLDAFHGHPTSIFIQFPSEPGITQVVVENVKTKILDPIKNMLENPDEYHKNKRRLEAYKNLIGSLRSLGVAIPLAKRAGQRRKRNRDDSEGAPSAGHSTDNNSLNRQALINPAHPADLDSRLLPVAGVKEQKKLVDDKPSTRGNDNKLLTA
ncbi:hypothetical protein H0H93_011061, partial [Arthromyces matolae]